MARRFGLNRAALDELFQRIEDLGAVEGLHLRPATARPVSSFDAHRIIHLAAEHDLASPMAEQLFHAHLTDNRNIADHRLLAELAGRTGLDADAVRHVLTGDAYAQRVRADEDRAARLGVRQVPAFVIDGEPVLSGAPSADALLALLRRADPGG
jgi:predicted DsbA family dithiol-disulfide isomerase